MRSDRKSNLQLRTMVTATKPRDIHTKTLNSDRNLNNENSELILPIQNHIGWRSLLVTYQLETSELNTIQRPHLCTIGEIPKLCL